MSLSLHLPKDDAEQTKRSEVEEGLCLGSRYEEKRSERRHHDRELKGFDLGWAVREKAHPPPPMWCVCVSLPCACLGVIRRLAYSSCIIPPSLQGKEGHRGRGDAPPASGSRPISAVPFAGNRRELREAKPWESVTRKQTDRQTDSPL